MSFTGNIADIFDISWPTHETRVTTEGIRTLSSVERSKPLNLTKTETPQEPLRPLSAYNYFFREERERILKVDPTYDCDASDSKPRYTLEHQQELLNKHWNQDRTTKRRHRKSHGKISFSSLSKLVSQRWKELPEAHKGFYKELASKDWTRYQMDLAIYKECISQK